MKQKQPDILAKTKFKVPFGTVSITKDALKLIDTALKFKMVTRGKYVEEFERQFAKLMNVKHAVALSSGTDADALSLAALYDYGAKRGDEVIIPALTFVATGNAVMQAGFMPVFVDIRRDTLNIDVERIEKAITKKTCAIMPVHLMGKPAEMDTILAIAKKHRLFVVEDAAEAHGAEYKGKLVGQFGIAAAYSLYAAHIVTTIEGGIVTTNDAKMCEILKSLRNHGITNKFDATRIGFSAKMNELEAAVGIGNIKIFDKILKTRRRNLLYLMKKFKPFEEYFLILKEEAHEKIGPHAFSIVLKEGLPFSKKEFVDYIESNGIDSRNLFYSIPTQCPSYAFLGYRLGEFPEAEYCSDHGTHIGIHQDLTLTEMDHIAYVVSQFIKKYG